MIAELIFAGTELLLGQIVNTNAQYLSRRLAATGVDVYHQTTVGDNRQRLEEAVRTALGRADVVITGGGLGPTSDDLTKEAVAAASGRPLLLDAASREAVEAFYASLGRRMTANSLRQAFIPRGAEPIPNSHGTAPGVRMEVGGKLLFMLPGPPNEFMPMVEEAVIPALRARDPSGMKIISRVLRLCGIGEAEVESRLEDVIGGQAATTVAPLASPGEVALRLTTKAQDEASALEKMGPVEAQIRSRLGRFVYGTDDDTLAGSVLDLLASADLTLAVAESCTGGLLADQLTDVPGASDRLLAGVVAYTNDAKVRILGIPRETISGRGPVSDEVCAAMAVSVRRLCGSDLGVSITGIAGPAGGSETTPVGLVFIGLSSGSDGQVRVARHRFPGSRRVVKGRAARQALVVLRDHLLELLSGLPDPEQADSRDR